MTQNGTTPAGERRRDAEKERREGRRSHLQAARGQMEWKYNIPAGFGDGSLLRENTSAQLIKAAAVPENGQPR